MQSGTASGAKTLHAQDNVSAPSSDVNKFNLQCGISVSLPNNRVISTDDSDCSILSAELYNDAGILAADFKIRSGKLENVDYDLKRNKNLNGKEKGEFAEKFVETYASSKYDSILNIENRQVIDHRIINLNGLFAVSLPAKGNMGAYKVTDELRCIFFDEHMASAVLLYFEPDLPLRQSEIDLILGSIAPVRK